MLIVVIYSQTILMISSLQTGTDDVDEHARHHPERQGQGGHQGPDEVRPQEAERGRRTKWIAGQQKNSL